MTPDSLAGLARLLEKLSSYFKVEIGKKLLDHLDYWASQQHLEAAADRAVCESTEAQVVIGVLDLMHLLPQQAVMYLPDMVMRVISCNLMLKRSSSSPFMSPLIRFLNKYPQDCTRYFMANIGD